MAGLYAPLPTLRRHPRGGLRTARGRCGSLLLHRSGPAPPTPCRSPGAPTETSVSLGYRPRRNETHQLNDVWNAGRQWKPEVGCSVASDRLARWIGNTLEDNALWHCIPEPLDLNLKSSVVV